MWRDITCFTSETAAFASEHERQNTADARHHNPNINNTRVGNLKTPKPSLPATEQIPAAISAIPPANAEIATANTTGISQIHRKISSNISQVSRPAFKLG